MVTVRGVNLYPAAVEEIVRSCQGVGEYRVVFEKRTELAEVALGSGAFGRLPGSLDSWRTAQKDAGNGVYSAHLGFGCTGRKPASFRDESETLGAAMSREKSMRTPVRSGLVVAWSLGLQRPIPK